MSGDGDRQRYLAAMGISQWRLRDTQPAAAQLKPDTASTPVSEPVTDPVANPATLSPAPQQPVANESSESSESSAPTESSTPDPRERQIATLDWDALREAVDRCQACPLHASRTRAVFGVGDRSANWMIVGEAPGADEDRLGEPFVGRAGKLLDLMLVAMGLHRESVYISNILKSRPPGNRDPQADEMQACWPYLGRQIELLQPKIILTMGRIAAQTLLNSKLPVGKLRGQLHRYHGPGSPPDGVPLLVTYHPAYLLRSPREKRKSWDDLRLALNAMQQLSGATS